MVVAHEAGDAVFGGAKALGAEFTRHTRAAVGAGMPVLMDGVHGGQEDLVKLAAGAGGAPAGGVVAAGRDVEGIAELGDGVVNP